MCGATSEQKNVYNAQYQLMNELTDAYKAEFGTQQSILSALTSQFQPILAAGPNQEGFSAGEKAALNTQATEGVGTNYANAAKAVGNQIAAQGGGNEFLPSGANDQLREELASSGAGELSKEQNIINQNDYSTGRSNFYNAATGLESAASLSNPVGTAGAAIGSSNAAANSADQIAAANNAWMGALGGLAGGALSGWASGGFKMPGGG